jgi:hypothetical protein
VTAILGTDAAACGSSGMAWKLIVAAEKPWTGEIYHTRPGHRRPRFTTPETFCLALLEITAWPLPTTESTLRQRQSTRPSRVGEAGKTKFVVSAHAPWTGEVYRTRPGLGRLSFATFEECVRAVTGVTGWPLSSPVANR